MDSYTDLRVVSVCFRTAPLEAFVIYHKLYREFAAPRRPEAFPNGRYTIRTLFAQSSHRIHSDSHTIFKHYSHSCTLFARPHTIRTLFAQSHTIRTVAHYAQYSRGITSRFTLFTADQLVCAVHTLFAPHRHTTFAHYSHQFTPSHTIHGWGRARSHSFTQYSRSSHRSNL